MKGDLLSRKRGKIYLKEMFKVLDIISQPFSDIMFK